MKNSVNAKQSGKKKTAAYSRRRYNRELYLWAGLFLLLFGSMFLYLTVYVTSNHEELFNNSYNSRQKVLAGENRRGTIYSADEKALAQTVSTPEGSEKREYPFGAVFSHVVGYTQKGRTGIEELENYLLRI